MWLFALKCNSRQHSVDDNSELKTPMLEFRGQDEEQCSEGDSDDAKHASNLTAKKKPQAHRKDHFTVKTREVSQRNPGQKPTVVKRKPGVPHEFYETATSKHYQ